MKPAAFVALRPCGCQCAAVLDMRADAQKRDGDRFAAAFTLEQVREFRARGLRVELMDLAQARSMPRTCGRQHQPA